MIPMRSTTIFKNRWMTLLWAAGVLWFAYDVAGGSAKSADGNSEQATDVTGAPVSADDAKNVEQALNGL